MILSLYYTCDHCVRIIWRLFDRLAMQIHWLVLCYLDALIEMYSSYLIHVLFVYLCFCLLILLILLFVVDDVGVAYWFFNSFDCSCPGSSMYFTFLSVISTLLFMLPLFIKTLLFICYHYSLFLLLFSLLTHYVTYSSFEH